MDFRKMARVVNIDNILPIKDADNIELAVIGGWNVAVKKQEFFVGGRAIYFEIDSMLPIGNKYFEFLSHRPSKLYFGQRYHKIRTIKLCGIVSQGLLIPLTQLDLDINLEIDTDVSKMFGILKFEEEFDNEVAPIEVIDNFPSFMPRTDQKRIQNLSEKLDFMDGVYEVSMKIDGVSISAFKKDGKIGIASRKTILEENDESKYKEGLVNSGIWSFLENHNGDIAIQGELVGPKLCGNKEGFETYDVLIFDIFDIESQRYWLSEKRIKFCEEFNLKHVPIIGFKKLSDFDNVQEIIKFAEGPSLNSKIREGLVFKKVVYDEKGQVFSFKAISNKWLLTYT